VKSGASKEVVSGECYTQGAIHAHAKAFAVISWIMEHFEKV